MSSALLVSFTSASVARENKVKCVKCGAETAVLGSRPHHGNIRRRRECKQCKHRIFTIEVLEEPKAVKPTPAPKTKKTVFKKRMLKPRLTDLDMDNMSDEELEQAIYDGRIG